MELGVLGPVEVRAGGRVLDSGHARRRAVLAVLLLDLGRVVPMEALIDRVWGEEPPASVLSTLYGYVSRLRSVIAGAPDRRATLSRRPGGYLLQANAEQLDLRRFHRLAAEAAGADDRRGAVLLRQALGLWRGPALADVRSPWLNVMRDTLEAARLAALADLSDIRLRQGEHGALVGELTGQAAARLGDERLIAQLMLALYRSGRQAEALHWFERTRQHLASEIGVDPGTSLRALHQQILRADPVLTAAGGVAVRQGPVPRQLPPGVPAFTGRAAGLADLDAAGAAGKDAVPVIVTVSGTAGAGKTALAARWARQSVSRFPDGQLYADLRGFGPADAPATATETIGGFLDALGIAPERVPLGQDEQAALYRGLLASRQMLIVLDNARDEQQVRPLLPDSPRSLVLVTSRNRLTGLAAADGARLVTLDVLPPGEAVHLLTARLGHHAAADPAADPAAIAEIAALCAGLPAALAAAAARAAAQPNLPLTALATELRDAADRLDALDSGDPATSVRTLFSWSYQQLSPGAARMFRLLNVHPGPDITVHAAASTVGVDQAGARRTLRELTRAHLVSEHLPGRYTLHGLLRAYAADQARAHDSQPERAAAASRLLDHYLHTAVRGARLLDPVHGPVELAAPAPGVTPEPLADTRQARAWFQAEQRVLAAAATLATASGFDAHAQEIHWSLILFGQHSRAAGKMKA